MDVEATCIAAWRMYRDGVIGRADIFDLYRILEPVAAVRAVFAASGALLAMERDGQRWLDRREPDVLGQRWLMAIEPASRHDYTAARRPCVQGRSPIVWSRLTLRRPGGELMSASAIGIPSPDCRHRFGLLIEIP